MYGLCVYKAQIWPHTVLSHQKVLVLVASVVTLLSQIPSSSSVNASDTAHCLMYCRGYTPLQLTAECSAFRCPGVATGHRRMYLIQSL